MNKSGLAKKATTTSGGILRARLDSNIIYDTWQYVSDDKLNYEMKWKFTMHNLLYYFWGKDFKQCAVKLSNIKYANYYDFFFWDLLT